MSRRQSDVFALCAVLACAVLACAAALDSADYNLLDLFGSKTNKYDCATAVRTEQTAAAEDPVPVNERFPSAVLFGRTCGGTIISSKWVLSAAHCTLFTGGRDVLAGTNQSDNDTGVRVRVKKLYIHPLFSVGPYWLDATRYNIKQVAARWDYLLAELAEPLPLDGKTMVAATLDGPEIFPTGAAVGYAGYGAENHGETMRHEMHAMSLNTLADAECARLPQYNAQDMLCARGRPPSCDSACNGDSGSGLMLGGRVVGVTSWVENDAFECRRGAMVVFSRVSAARPWIKEVTGL